MLIELLRSRRSIRRYTDQAIEQEKVGLLIEAMLRSPSSRSLNPWHFIVVRESERLAALAKAKPHGASFLKGAPLAIVVCADPEKSDVWVEDASIASLLIHLQAADLGLGSCWVQIRKRPHDEQHSAQEYLTKELELKNGLQVEAIIAIGYPAEEKAGHGEDSLLKERVSYEYYGKKG